MKIVIDIPDYNLESVQNGSIACGQILKVVKNGTPLPKGHGRLIDADKLYPDCLTKEGTLAISQSQIANAPTVDTTFKEVVAYECGQKSVERPTGEWVVSGLDYKCSNCGMLPYFRQYNFCPNCGVDMRGGRE